MYVVWDGTAAAERIIWPPYSFPGPVCRASDHGDQEALVMFESGRILLVNFYGSILESVVVQSDWLAAVNSSSGTPVSYTEQDALQRELLPDVNSYSVCSHKNGFVCVYSRHNGMHGQAMIVCVYTRAKVCVKRFRLGVHTTELWCVAVGEDMFFVLATRYCGECDGCDSIEAYSLEDGAFLYQWAIPFNVCRGSIYVAGGQLHLVYLQDDVYRLRSYNVGARPSRPGRSVRYLLARSLGCVAETAPPLDRLSLKGCL